MQTAFSTRLVAALPQLRRFLNLKGRQAGLQMADIDELFGLASCKAWQAADRFNLDRPIWPWLKRIGLNTLRDRLDGLGRQRKRQVSLDVFDAEGNRIIEPVAADPIVDEPSRLAMDRGILNAVLVELRQDHRQVVELMLEGVGNKETAARLGLKPSTVGTIVCRFRKRLRAALV